MNVIKGCAPTSRTYGSVNFRWISHMQIEPKGEPVERQHLSSQWTCWFQRISHTRRYR
jgi:hypothetical protein